ncbi:MAG: TetR/AcrR family transcriptional regulator [Ruminococcaceae bacterium]|nr:TetR/AcrR family transcriptional regulator [Oscillospiraceae bacterium]
MILYERLMLKNDEGRQKVPPKVKFTREEIIDAAIELVRESGIEMLTSRELGKKMGVSARPIFTAFENMGEVKNEVFERAKAIYAEYQNGFENYSPAFKRYGRQIIHFAQKEPQLFKLLFMSQGEGKQPSFYDAVNSSEDMGIVLDVLARDYHLDREKATRLVNLLWVQVYGISVMIVQGVCYFTEEVISDMLSTTFIGAISALRSENTDEYLRSVRAEKTNNAN